MMCILRYIQGDSKVLFQTLDWIDHSKKRPWPGRSPDFSLIDFVPRAA